ncbi:MAG: alpha/Beta hydrolase fold [Microbacteriaceae bacterium]|nr:alpha/Beta hydrolase fold [Microbacteriaceae bacterium]
MTAYTTSRDGTRIAFDREGTGPAVILVGGAMQFRAFDPTTRELAHLLAERGFTVVNYDRRGRGESGDTLPFAVEREVEDIAALIDEIGDGAALFGGSSGAVLCLWAAAAGLDVAKLALWEAPLTPEGEVDDGETLEALQKLIANDDREAAVAYFMRDMPREWFEGARNSPAWPVMLTIAPTLAYDTAVLDKATKSPWAEQWSTVTQPTLVLLGEQTQPIFPPAADALVAALADARQQRLDAANHSWRPEVMADALEAFLRE